MTGETKSMMSETWIVAAGIAGFAGVALGAAGTHLTGGDPTAAALIETASRFVLVHALALAACGAFQRTRRDLLLTLAGTGFLVGSLLFGGGLTIYATTGASLAKWSTPVGGTLLMAGWLALGLYGLTARRGRL
jgi:uncharacterized membrane protein YgdD (TMEM256/DUF423 family)